MIILRQSRPKSPFAPSGVEEVNHPLEGEIRHILNQAGIKVLETRISHLAFFSGIASARLQGQQGKRLWNEQQES